MRFQTLVFSLTTFFMAIAVAAPLDIGGVFEASKKLRLEATVEKAPAKKLKELRDLQNKLTATKKEYQKINPEQGDSTEKKVLMFDATFDPLFDVKLFNKENCEKVQDRIESENAMGKEDNAPLTEEAKEAVEWIKVLCDPNKPAKN